MFANVFLILCAYYFIKPLREGWIAVSDITGLSKMEVKAYSSFGQSIVLVPVVWLYGRLSGRYRRSDIITRSTLFCVLNLAVFWAIQPGLFIEYLPYTGIIFYLWVGMFGVFVVAQFWAFAADVYTMERGNRLFPVIAVGATSGAACGSWITEFLVGSGLLGTEWLLIVSMIPLIASIFLSRMVDGRMHEQPAGTKATPGPDIEDSGRSAISIVFTSRLLLATALITLLLSWVNTNGENLLFRVVQEFLKGQALKGGISNTHALMEFTRDGTTAFYGDFYFWVNVVALILQAFVASRLLKYGGFGVILLTMPVVALVSYTAMAFIPIQHGAERLVAARFGGAEVQGQADDRFALCPRGRRDCSPYSPRRSPASGPFDSVVLRTERGAGLHLDHPCVCGDSRAPPFFRAKRIARDRLLFRLPVNTVHSPIHHRRKAGQTFIALWVLHQGHDDVLIPVLYVEDDTAVGMKSFPGARFAKKFRIGLRLWMSVMKTQFPIPVVCFSLDSV
jgi:AAA family ATP:ADP antiporter